MATVAAFGFDFHRIRAGGKSHADCAALGRAKHRRSSAAPARHDLSLRHAPAIAKSRRRDAESRRNRGDQGRRRRTSAAVMRQQHHVRCDRLRQQQWFGRRFRIREQERFAPGAGDRERA